MTITTPLKPTKYQSRLGLEVLQGCDLRSITEAQRQELKQSLWEHGVIVVKKQKLTASELEEFAQKTFGDFKFRNPSFTFNPDLNRDIQSPYTAILGNPKGFDQKPAEQIYGATQWHQDKDFIPKIKELDMNALYVVMAYSIKVPPEGENGQPHTTEFLDLVEAYDNLEPSYQKELAQLSMYQMQPMFEKQNLAWDDIPKKLYPLVSTHKVTEANGLYLGSWNTSILEGMENNFEEAQKYWQTLFQKVLECTPIYSHVWEEGDLIFWDNSQVMHRGTFYDSTKYQRIALRLGIVDCQ